MTAIRRALLAGVATILIAAACTSVTIPTIPPIPSFAIPSFAIPSFAIPSLGVPGSPVAPGNSLCALASTTELAAAMGASGVTAVPDEEGQCTVTPEGEFIGIVIRSGEGETIEAAKMITSNGQDLTVGGSPAYYGELMGGILYIQKGDRMLVLQAPLNNELKDELIAVGNLVAPRF